MRAQDPRDYIGHALREGKSLNHRPSFVLMRKWASRLLDKLTRTAGKFAVDALGCGDACDAQASTAAMGRGLSRNAIGRRGDARSNRASSESTSEGERMPRLQWRTADPMHPYMNRLVYFASSALHSFRYWRSSHRGNTRHRARLHLQTQSWFEWYQPVGSILGRDHVCRKATVGA